jgi:Spy/CpxP family protein refolding chaperone
MKLLQTALFVVAGLSAGCAGNTPAVSTSSQPAVAETPGAEISADQESADTVDLTVQVLKTELNLTEQQTQELNKIFKENGSQKAFLRKQMRSLNKLREERMNAVLTAEQKNKLEQMNRESMEQLNSQQPPEPFQQSPK